MATILSKQALLFTYAIFAYVCHIAQATDPNIISDFIVPANITTVDANFFTFTGFRTIFTTEFPSEFKTTKANLVEFPALNGQSVSYLIVQFPVGTVNPPHTHPRSSELIYVLLGCLEVGFIDTSNKLYTQTLQVGDIFVVPKGLVHYQYNANAKEPAMALTAFGSANGGKVSFPTNLFGSGIDDGVLAKSFKTDVDTIKKIKAGLATKGG